MNPTTVNDLDVGRAGRPLPILTATNRPFWEATRRRELMLPRCPACDRWIYPISTLCWGCDAGEPLVWAALSGRGTVSSWVVYHRAFRPFQPSDLPYAVLEVELEEGPRMIGAAEGLAIEDIHAGLAVRAAFRDADEEFTLVVFASDDDHRDA
jgi:uncharacterized OB-fold protein